ncbi:hypothetical protein [Bartonella sp. WD12.1]|nr:hypothetical protein [Bartonella sp. WD12.1]
MEVKAVMVGVARMVVKAAEVAMVETIYITVAVLEVGVVKEEM